MSTTQPEALRENYTAADMATASAQGFRDGVASVAAGAGSEPVAHLWQHSETGRTRVVMPDMVVDASATWLPVGPLYLHPSPPEGAGWKWVPKILSAEMVDAWASARLPGGIAQMTDDEANRAVAQANWDSMIAAAPPPPAQAADSVLEDAARYRHLRDCNSGSQPVVPAGYALVPVEPTPEMLSEIWVHKNGSLSEAYRAMLAAAPQPVAREPLTDEQIEKLRRDTFSTENPFCPCDSKTMRKAVWATEREHGIGIKNGDAP